MCLQLLEPNYKINLYSDMVPISIHSNMKKKRRKKPNRKNVKDFPRSMNFSFILFLSS